MELGSEIKSRAAAALPELAEEIGGAAGAIGFDLRSAERCDGAIFLVGDGEKRQLLLIADIGGGTESGNKPEIYNKAGSDSEPASGGSAAQYGSAVGDTSRIDVERGTVFTCRDDVGSVCLEYKDSTGEHLLCRADMSYAKLYAGLLFGSVYGQMAAFTTILTSSVRERSALNAECRISRARRCAPAAPKRANTFGGCGERRARVTL